MRHNRAHSDLSEGPGLIPQPLAPERRAPIPAVDLRPVRGHSIDDEAPPALERRLGGRSAEAEFRPGRRSPLARAWRAGRDRGPR